MIKGLNKKLIFRYILLASLIYFFILCYKLSGVTLFNNLILIIQDDIENAGIISLAGIFLLRFISIIIPVLPGTYCSVLAGYIYGIERGMLLIFFADYLSCSSSFMLSRKLGRGFIKNLLGVNQMKQIEKVSHDFLEDNFFLMTSLLMTQFFDFACYSIGLTKVPWKKFMPALFLSIIISDIPFVAGGYAINNIRDVSVKKILNGEVDFLYGQYLAVFIVSIVLLFLLGIVRIFFKRKTQSSN